MATPVFELAHLFAFDSPLPAGGASPASGVAALPATRTDYLPIVRVNYDYAPLNALIAPAGTPGFITRVPLGRSFDTSNRVYQAPAIVIAKGTPALLPLRIELGFDPIGLQDNDGCLIFSCTNGAVKLRFWDEEDPADVDKDTAPYELRRSAIGDEFVLAISHTLPRGARFEIDITATDNRASFDTYSPKRTRCGKLYLKVLERDVFLTDDIQRAKDEFTLVASYVNIDPDEKTGKLKEYLPNYCMQGAERALGKMLHTTKDFYCLDEDHNHLNNVSFAGKGGARGKTANDRGLDFTRMGYTGDFLKFNGYKVNFNELYKIVDDVEQYQKVKYKVVTIADARALNTFIHTTALTRLGYHVYYLTLTNAYHTLLLFIDNTRPAQPTYEIWDDQSPLTSARGPVSQLGQGMAGQTSWTFAHEFKRRHQRGQYGQTVSRLWKIHRK